MFIARVTAVTDELLAAFANLVPQLKKDFPLPASQDLQALLDSRSSLLYIARFPNEESPIVGMLTLVVYRVPTGIRARIEDVIVDNAARGQGVGEALARYALSMAREAGADGVALTSNPRREVANRLYQRVGFKPWRTNIYFYKF